MSQNKPVLIIHGGAGSSKNPNSPTMLVRREALERILNTVYEKLNRGWSARKAVVLAVEMLEDDPQFNAGLGSKIQSDGKIRMSASLMDGETLRFSGVVNVERIKNPIRLAERLLTRPPANCRVLSGAGAARFAREEKLEFRSPYTPKARQDFEKSKKGKSGTVGAVALDRDGRLAAATSTGGRGYEYPHRVSDTPTVAGNYADKHCAVSATGIGEEIVDFSVASYLCTLRAEGIPLEEASRRLKSRAGRQRARFGWIAVDRKGQIVVDTTTAHIIWAAAHSRGFILHP